MKNQERPKLILLHSEFKSIHFLQAARYYLKQKNLAEKKCIAFEERIIQFAHPYVLMLQNIIKAKNKSKASANNLEIQLEKSKEADKQAELIRRIKIGYHNSKQSKSLFIGFWKFLSKQLSLHSHCGGTEAQQAACLGFELKIQTIV